MDRPELISIYSLDEEAPTPVSPTKKRKKLEGKDPEDVKKLVAEIVAGRMDAFETDLGMIKSPKDRCEVMLKLMQFVLPKVSAVDVTGALEMDSVSDEVARLAQQTKTDVAAKTKKDITS